MSEIFISYSSHGKAKALAVGQWLKKNRWDSFFLNIEPAKGGSSWSTVAEQESDVWFCYMHSPSWTVADH